MLLEISIITVLKRFRSDRHEGKKDLRRQNLHYAYAFKNSILNTNMNVSG